MKREKVTLHDIAKAAGVSQMTVSRAIRGEPGVGKKLQSDIVALAQSMGYIPNRSLHDSSRRNSSMTVGVVLPYLGNIIFAEILENMESIFSLYGYRLFVCCSYNNIIKEFHDVSSLLERQVDGIIWAPLHLKDSRQCAKLIMRERVPLVFVDRVIPNCQADSVLVDDFDGSLQLTRHLLDQGFRKIAYVGSSQESYVESERRNGFLRGMEERSLPVPDEWIWRGDSDISSGKEAAARLLDCRERPDAVFCFNDMLSIGVEMGLLDGGVRIPEDMALAGFSGTLEMEIAKVPITGVFQDAASLGRISAEFLLRRMITSREIRMIPENLVLKTRLVARESSRKRG